LFTGTAEAMLIECIVYQLWTPFNCHFVCVLDVASLF
jgi:hypothetical protein